MRFYILLIIVLFGKQIAAQTLEGVVLDYYTKQPIKEVNVISNDNLKGCYTDDHGRFEIEVNSNTILSISHIGYLKNEIEINTIENSIKVYLYPAPIQLNDVQIKITKNNLLNISQSASISTLSEKQIEENVSRSMAEAMIGTEGVWMQKTNHGGGSPFIRGLTGNYVLLLVDGIRMNNSTFRFGPNQYFNTISPFSVSSIEVLRGAGSVLYGSDAIGGTININTKNPSLSGDKRIFGTATGQIMSHQMEYTGVLELGGNHKNFAFITNGSIRNFGDNYAGKGIGYQRPSGYSEKDFLFKGLWKFEDNSKLIFNYQWLRQDDVPRYDQVVQKDYEYYNFTLQQRQLAFLRYDKNWENSSVRELQVTASYQESNEERDTKKNDVNTQKNERDDVSTLGLTSQMDAILFKRVEMVAGIDSYFDKVHSARSITDTETGEIIISARGLYPDGSSAISTAVYNTYLYDSDRWNFQLGWRYNYTLNKIEDQILGPVNQSSSSLIGKASINYQINNHHIYTTVNTGFRAPNINDLSSLGDFDYGVEIPTNDLNPETSTNFEIGYKIAKRTFSFNVAYYYLYIQDLIDRVRVDPDEDIYKKANVGEAFVTGFELGFQSQLSTYLSINGSMTYTYGENITKDEPFRRIPPLFGDLSIRYERKNYFIILQNLAANKQDRLSGGDIDDHRIPEGGTSGWYVANIKGGMAWKRFSFQLAFNNLFNQAYRMHGSGVDGQGRHLAASLNYHFN
jgi:outer membrane receptor protein involved in Fe transport